MSQLNPNPENKFTPSDKIVAARVSVENLYFQHTLEKLRVPIDSSSLYLETRQRLAQLIGELDSFEDRYAIQVLAASAAVDNEDRSVLVNIRDRRTGCSVYPNRDFSDVKSVEIGENCAWVILLDTDPEEFTISYDSIFDGCIFTPTTYNDQYAAFMKGELNNQFGIEILRYLDALNLREPGSLTIEKASLRIGEGVGFLISCKSNRKLVGEFAGASPVSPIKLLWLEDLSAKNGALGKNKSSTSRLLNNFCHELAEAGATILPEESWPDLSTSLELLSGSFRESSGINFKERGLVLGVEVFSTTASQDCGGNYVVVSARDKLGVCHLPSYASPRTIRDDYFNGLYCYMSEGIDPTLHVIGLLLSAEALEKELNFLTKNVNSSIFTTLIFGEICQDLENNSKLGHQAVEMYSVRWKPVTADYETNRAVYCLLVEHSYGTHLLWLGHYYQTGIINLLGSDLRAGHYYPDL